MLNWNTMHKLTLAAILTSVLIGSGCAAAQAQPPADTQVQAADPFGPLPQGDDPAVVGKLLVNNFTDRALATKSYGYPEACTAYGSMRFAAAIGDADLLKSVLDRYSVLTTPAGRKVLSRAPGNEDASIAGIIPLEIYRQTGDQRYLEIGKAVADNQWSAPEDSAASTRRAAKPGAISPESIHEWVQQGLSKQTRFWIDDMFMITILQLEAYRATGDKTY